MLTFTPILTFLNFYLSLYFTFYVYIIFSHLQTSKCKSSGRKSRKSIEWHITSHQISEQKVIQFRRPVGSLIAVFDNHLDVYIAVHWQLLFYYHSTVLPYTAFIFYMMKIEYRKTRKTPIGFFLVRGGTIMKAEETRTVWRVPSRNL